MGIQRLRNLVQVVVAALVLAAGYQFYLFVSHFRRGTEFVPRPPSIEAWLPIANLVALKSWVVNGTYAEIHPAGLAIFVATLLVAVLFHRGFCSWICPIGLLEEVLGRLGLRAARVKWTPPWPVDYGLRSVKYLILLLFVKVIVIDMPGPMLDGFLHSPYNKVVMVKMLDFWIYPSGLIIAFTAGLAVASLFVQNVWCRYLCPYGALIGAVGVLSPFRITRDPEPCIGCGSCSRACLNHIDVKEQESVGSQECTRCFRCIDACPSGALSLSRARPVHYAAALVGLFFLVLLVAQLTGHWENSVSYETYERLIPIADRFTHDTGM